MGLRSGRAGRDRGVGDWPEDDDVPLDAMRRPRRSRGLTGVLALAISGLVLYLAWCALWERSHPASGVARRVGKGDAGARLGAIAELERLGPQDPEVALPALIGRLGDPEPKNGAAAAEALETVIQSVQMNDSDPRPIRDAVPDLIGGLRDPRPGVRARALHALATIAMLWPGAPGIVDREAIAAAIGETAADRDAEVRLAAVRGLSMLGPPLTDDPPPLLLAALADESEEVRVAATVALSQFTPQVRIRLIPSLVQSLEAGRPEVRPAYLGLLRTIRPSGPWQDPAQEMVPALTSALGSRDRDVRCQVLSSLGEFGDKGRVAIPAMLAILGEAGDGSPADSPGGPSANDPVAAAAAALAGVAGATERYGPTGVTKVGEAREAVPPLIELLESPVAGRRLAAVEALRAFVPDDALLAAFIASSRDRDATVRAAAVMALSRGAPRLRPDALDVIRAALEDDSPKVRAAAASALFGVETGVEPMVPALLRHAELDPDRSVRDACAYALGSLGPPVVTAAVVPMYIAAIDRPGAPVLLRESLIDVLTRFRPEASGAVPAIARALRSAERDASREILPRTPNSGTVPQSADERAAESDAWARLELRRNAITALGRLAPGTPSAGDAVSALAEALDDPDDEVNRQTVEALVAFGPAARASAPAMVRLLRRARDKKNLLGAGQAAEALGKIDPAGPGGGEAVVFLDEVLGSEGLAPRLFAERVLGSFGPSAAPAIPRLVALSRRPALRASPELASVVAALGQIAPGTPEEGPALAALRELLEVGPGWPHIETVIIAVARFGPGAMAALPRLREMADSGDPQVRQAARRAVADLEASGRPGRAP